MALTMVEMNINADSSFHSHSGDLVLFAFNFNLLLLFNSRREFKALLIRGSAHCENG